MPLLNTKNATKKINRLLKRNAESFCEIGSILAKIKTKQESFEDKDKKQKAKEEYNAFLETLPFGVKVANKLIQIANDEVIGNNLDIMPVAYNTMYSLIGYSDKQFAKFREEGLNSFSTAKEVSEIIHKSFYGVTKTEWEIAKADAADTETQEVFQGLKNKVKENTDYSDFKVTDDTDDDVIEPLDAFTVEEVPTVESQSIVIGIDPTKLTTFEKVKLNDLLSKIERMKFTSEKGVTVDTNINPNVLSTESPDTQVA